MDKTKKPTKSAKKKNSEKRTKSPKIKIKRYITIDAFRGFAVVMMIFVSTLYLLTYNIPFFLLHNQGDIFLFFDLVAPIFQFVLGMSLFLFILHRQSHGIGGKEITWQILKRYIALIAIGFVLDAITYADFSSWGVLETLGLGGILTFAVSSRTNNEKILICILILAVYSLLYFNPLFSSLISMPHGGPVGALSYSVLSILGFMVAEKLYKRKSNRLFFLSMLKYACLLIVLGLFLGFIIPINKTHASPSFILASAGIVIIFYLTFFAVYKSFDYTFDILRTFGRTALAMWIGMYMIVWLFSFFIEKRQFLDFPIGLFASIITVVFMYFVALFLGKRDIKLGL